MDLQFKLGFMDRYPFAIYDPIRNKFTGLLAPILNKYLERYDSINYTVILLRGVTFGNCDSVNCTGLLGLIQQGQVDFSEIPYTLSTVADSAVGLKPGPVVGDLSCNILSALPEIGVVREDVLKSLSVFTLGAIIFLAFLILFLFSIPFILWYFKFKFLDIRTNSPPIIWPLICEVLHQWSSQMAFFHPNALRFIWMSTAFILLFIAALYSASFTTDLTSKLPIKTIDSLEDVANCDRIPIWMETPLCRIMVSSGSLRAEQEILRRGQHKTLGNFVDQLETEKGKIEKYVFVIAQQEIDNLRLSYCTKWPDSPQWYQSTGSFPVHLRFFVLNSKLPPHATKILNKLHEKQFENRIEIHLQDKYNSYVEKAMDPHQKFGCSHKTSIKFTPALYRFNQLDADNYKLFFKRFLFMIPICILCLIVEYLTVSIMPK